MLDKILNKIERVGNKLPDPVSIFGILCVLVVIISCVASLTGLTAVHPSTGETMTVVNQLSSDAIRTFLSKMVTNFTGFAPLGLVLVVMLGAGVAEKTGFMEVAMKQSVTKIPKAFLTTGIIFIGICANIAADAGYVVLPPLAAIIFLGVGRHPLVGMFAAYAGVAAGFSACIMVSLIDVLLLGFTVPAAQIIDPSYVGNPAMNMYFLIISAIVLAVVGGFVTEKVIAPRFENSDFEKTDAQHNDKILTELEKKGLNLALKTLLGCILVIVVLCIGDNAILNDPATGSLLSSSSGLMAGLVPIITMLFLVPGIVFGVVTKKIKTDKDMTAIMASSLSDMGMYIVLAFAASQFIYLFNASNLAIVLSIKGAEAIQAMGLDGNGLIVSFVIFAAFVNLFMASASAKWAILAPVFVPMFMLLGYSPALTQIAYRIGDSITNPLTPLFPYFPMLLAFARKYDKKMGMGSIIANMLPYSIAFFIVWIIQLVIFMQFNIPLGVDGGLFLSTGL
ncbi:aminobenzoyl-glutamate transporter [Candidatus Epulonipiscium fishelsonii]|uniref:Aminobenzoyl-glutamate transporter n=1 Tax=Candidatus Epulonipiscium fishelsonii TaxID=77094 RepID=A0ACC8XGW1_9FIRM|nr:aminobenzoyl-glutamate transporter [Epulopiscium sp. SCG-B05WGA-EpuloA1]ONI43012.1 aminobenzoyl-glutamate transporter [Epulopiscium sp. SCG-B11WGA-EpuloA1]